MQSASATQTPPASDAHGPGAGGGPRSRAAVWICAAALVGTLLAVGLRAPLALSPFFADDLVQMGFLADGDPSTYSFRNALDLFHFLDGDVEAAERKMERGDLPWRFDTTQRFTFLRPIPSATMWLDHELFGKRSVPAHLHSLLWFVVFLLVLHRLYSRLVPPAAAAVAVLAAALSPLTIQTIAWWTGRYALLTAVFAAAALWFHVRWSQSGRRRDLGVALAALLAALLSGESGVQTFAFVLAHAVITSGGRPKACFARLGPALAVVLAWLIAWVALGHGAEGNALYVSPLGEGWAYLQNVASRLPRAVFGLLVGDRSNLLGLAVALVGAGLLLRHRDRGRTTTAAWLLLGALLAVLPSFGGRNTLRPWTLVIPQIGVHAVLGLLVAAPWTAIHAGGMRSWLARAASLFVVVAAIVLPAQTLWTAARNAWRGGRDTPAELAREFPPATRQAITEDVERLVFLRSPAAVMPVARLRLWHGISGLSGDVTTLVASDTAGRGGDVVLSRPGPSTLVLRDDEPLVKADDVFRFDARRPFRPGQTVDLGDVAVRVVEVEDGRPVAVELSFARPPDAEKYLLLHWTGSRYRVVAPPEVGASLTLP